MEKRPPFREELSIILSRKITPFLIVPRISVHLYIIKFPFSKFIVVPFRFCYKSSEYVRYRVFGSPETITFLKKMIPLPGWWLREYYLCVTAESSHIILFRCYLLQEALEVLRTTPSTVELVVCRLPGDSNVTPPGAPPPPPARREPPPPLRLLNPLPPLQIEPCGVSNAPPKHSMNIYTVVAPSFLRWINKWSKKYQRI